MLIRTPDVPQADDLGKVLAAVLSVARGGNTYQDIAGAIALVERQGRYYRRAAEVLGFIRLAGRNQSELTAKGAALVAADDRRRQGLMAEAVLGLPLVQRMVPFLESRMPQGCTRDELLRFLEDVTEPTGPSMVPRRASTLLSWLQSLGIVRHEGTVYNLAVTPDLPVIGYRSEDEPLLPTRYDLQEYTEAARRAADGAATIRYEVSRARADRANEVHERLTSLVAQRVLAAGATPRRNSYIDLAATVADVPYLFEIKTTHGQNARAQVRRGVSQLYEYRYIQGTDDARLVLVLENPLPTDLAWMVAYLAEDRGILPVWDGDMQSLHCAHQHTDRLSFLL